MTLTPTAGGLTVQLTLMYPGAREDTLQYSISTLPSPLSRCQTGQQPLPVTDLTTPTSGSAEVALGPGTYSVTVNVTNQHGSTTSVPQQVAIPSWCYNPQDHTLVVLTICACGIAMLQYMHIPFACNAFYTPMHSLTSQNVFRCAIIIWDGLAGQYTLGWWCQCVCATDWGRYTQQFVVGLSIDILYYSYVV